MAFSVAERIILAVLAYSAKFDYPLTEKEITNRAFKPKVLIGLDGLKVSKKKLYRRDFSLALKSLVKKKKVIKKQDFYSLVATRTKSRKTNKKIEEFKKQVVDELTQIVDRVPCVLGVVITGSYAAGVVQQKDDLDFLIITKKNRLWLTRFLFLVLASIKGRRPHLPQGDLSHSWDFNFWLDETSLALPNSKKGIYEAYEIFQTKWIVDRQQIKKRFFKANSWVYDYFLFADFPQLKGVVNLPKSKFDWLLPVEFCFYKLQTIYRQLRHGKEKASLHAAFFHSTSTKGNILSDWQKFYYQAIGLKKKVLVTGVFDVLHQEHRNFLLAAKGEGTELVVGLESDKRVKELKGKNRPIFSQAQRKINLEKLKIADQVLILPEKFSTKEDHLKFIKKVKPSILAVSSHTAHLDKKQDIMQEVGGQLKIVYQHNPSISSTKLISK